MKKVILAVLIVSNIVASSAFAKGMDIPSKKQKNPGIELAGKAAVNKVQKKFEPLAGRALVNKNKRIA